jgi:hypothetical protein
MKPSTSGNCIYLTKQNSNFPSANSIHIGTHTHTHTHTHPEELVNEANGPRTQTAASQLKVGCTYTLVLTQPFPDITALTTVLIFLCFSFPIKDCTNNNAFLIEFWW